MKIFWDRELQNLLLSARLKDTAAGAVPSLGVGIVSRWASTMLILALLLVAATSRAQTNFASAEVLTGLSGSVVNDNSSVIKDPNCPNIAGFSPVAPLWYSWTAPQSGEVEMDTVGSVDDIFGIYPLDTVLAVFTGSSNNITGLNQVAANDNLFPINGTGIGNSESAFLTQFNESGSADYALNYGLPPGTIPVFEYPSPYYGPSHLRFNAVAGTTYYFAVDTEADSGYATSLTSYPVFPTGSVSLQWAYQSSGVFRFATEDFDPITSLPLYQTAGSESTPLAGSGNVDVNSPVFTYYPYNAPGVLVTVTRVAGSSGRCTVDYSTVAGTNLTSLGLGLPINDSPGVPGVDYIPASGTLVFDDYEMSKTVLIPIINDFGSPYGGGSGGNTNNVYFGLTLSNPQIDPSETASISTPRVDPTFSTAMVRILNPNADPYGPDLVTLTNFVVVTGTNGVSVTNAIPFLAIAAAPTNVLFSFEKSNYRVPEDVNSGPDGWTHVAIYVERYGTNNAATTLNYTIDDLMNDDASGDPGANYIFPLQPGSDYAVPTPPGYLNHPIQGASEDFVAASGTINFPATGTGSRLQEITFTVTNALLTKFNRDFKIELYREASYNNQTVAWLPGMVAETTVTILHNDLNPPAGSVDDFYDADFNNLLALPAAELPPTIPSRDANPGVGYLGIVNSLAVLTNDETLIAGQFDSFNGLDINGNPVGNIALLDTNGNLDTSFAPNSGADGPILSVVATTTGQYIIGGSFLSFNGQQQNYVARVNADGSLDGSFNPVVNGPVQSVVLQPDGKVLIGGSFTSIDNQSINCLARLNADGSLDGSFNPGTTLNGTVNAVAVQPGIYTNVVSNGNIQESDTTVNVSSGAAGLATVNFNFPQNNEMQVYYNGNLIYDTGVTVGQSKFNVSFGPGSAPLEFVVNPGGAQPATSWSYTAQIATNSEIMVGGNFSVAGQSYANVARFMTNGLLDGTFSNIVSGADNTINALGWQTDGRVVMGGAFQNFNGLPNNYLARLNWDGSLDTNFYVGGGADDIVWSVNIQPDSTIYVGGQFSEINGTHRLGFTRLYPNGSVDTTFMDTAYNQFAGLKRIFANDSAAVYASGVQNDSNIMIGGEFTQVGGGQASTNAVDSLDQQLTEEEGILVQDSMLDPNLWVEPKTRDGVRNRSGIARLIGGATPGPGNIQFESSSFSGDKSQSSLTVSLVRTNGALGPLYANFSVIPGLAQNGSDYLYDSLPPLYWEQWEYLITPSRDHSDGLYGLDGSLEDIYGQLLPLSDLAVNNLSVATVSIINNTQKSGNENAGFQLANPSGASDFYLGSENIPICAALGPASAPFTIIDDTSQSGMIGFTSTNYFATNTTATISLVRSNGIFGTVTLRCFATNGTAVAGTDYTGVTNLSRSFPAGVQATNYPVTILANGQNYTGFTGKTINLRLSSLAGGNSTYGISNAVLTIINPNFQGYLTLSATNYTGNVNAGSMTFVVNRVSGSSGQISVMYATTNGTAFNGTNYIGSTNQLAWSSGDVSSRTITIPILNNNLVGGSEQFGVRLFNPTNSSGLATSLFFVGSPGSITNATMTITNNNSYGTVQLSAPSYLVSENGGYATITVVRTGGATGTVSVNYNTTDGTATQGVNYVTNSGTLVFGLNQTATNFNVQIVNDGVQDPTPFYFNVNLSNPTNASLSSASNAPVNILDVQTYIQPPGSTNGNFNANLNGAVLALALQTNGEILAGGDFTAVDGAPQNNIARLQVNGALDSSFTAGANGPVQAVVCQTDGNVVIGGSFGTVDGISRNGIARVATNGVLDTTFNPGSGANGTVYALGQTFLNGTNKIYVGGSFSTISSGPGNNTGSSANLARLYGSGTLDTTFNIGSGADGTVYAIAIYPTNSIYAGDLLIGGSFVHYNGVAVNGLARLTSSGALDTTFNLGSAATNGVVNTIVIQLDNNILVGGNFGLFNGTPASNIVRLNASGSTDTNFLASLGQGPNSTVNSIVLQPDNRIIVAGLFTEVGGVFRNGVTRLLPTGATDYTINFGLGANGAIDAAIVQPANGTITLGGAFTTYNGLPYNHIVQIYGLSETDSGVFQFNQGSYQVSETGIVAPVTIIRTGGTSGANTNGSGDIFVHFTTVNSSNSAVSGVNYYDVTTTLDFPPGESYETINIPILDDTVGTTNSWTVFMTLSAPTPPSVLGGDYSDVPLTILNANSVVSFLTAFTNVSETVSGGIANIGIARLGATNNACSISFSTSTNGSTAILGVDYYPTNNEIITFDPGVTEAAAQVLIISNATPEKTVSLVLTNPDNTLLFAPSNCLLTINNVNSPGELSFVSPNYVVNESSGSAVVTVQRQFGTSGNVFVNYATVPGTAQPGINYQSTSGILEIQGGFTSGNISVPILQNGPPSAPVSFSIVLSNATDNATIVPPTNTTVTIVDDVNTGVSFLNATNTFNETAGTISIPVERLGKTNSAFSVQYYTTNETALAGVNYVSNSSTLSFAAGQTLSAISVTLLNNMDVSNEQFGAVLYGTSPSSLPLEAPSNSVVVITPSAAGLSFTTTATNVFKNGISISVPVICLNPSLEPIIIDSNTVPLSVNYATVDGTAKAGQDYTAESGTLVFTNGISTNTITIPILNNSLITGLRTFNVNLSDAIPVPPAKIIAPSNEVITIIDSNSGLAFSGANYSIFNGGLVNITVLRVDNTNVTSTVNYATVGGGTAVAGTDYYPTNGTLTFTNGQTTASFGVTVIGSSTPAADKTIILQLSSPTNGVLMAPNVATLTIYNLNGSFVVPAGVSLGSSNYPPNGILQSNQAATLAFAFRDAGGTNVANLLATLLSGHGITSPVPSTPQSYGSLVVNGPSVSRQFTLTPVGTNGQTILAMFKLQNVSGGVTNNIGTNSFTLTIGTWSTTFSNTNLITFSVLPPAAPPAIASPYPSIITVSNVGGVLVGSAVTLTNFSATSPQALGVLVVSPQQQDTLLMANVGSADTGQKNITLSFADAALNYLPAVTVTNVNGTNYVIPIPSGAYKPTQYNPLPTSFP